MQINYVQKYKLYENTTSEDALRIILACVLLQAGRHLQGGVVGPEDRRQARPGGRGGPEAAAAGPAVPRHGEVHQRKGR